MSETIREKSIIGDRVGGESEEGAVGFLARPHLLRDNLKSIKAGGMGRVCGQLHKPSREALELDP